MTYDFETTTFFVTYDVASELVCFAFCNEPLFLFPKFFYESHSLIPTVPVAFDLSFVRFETRFRRSAWGTLDLTSWVKPPPTDVVRKLEERGDDLDSLQFVKSKGSALEWQRGGRESAVRAFESWPGVAFIDLVRSIFPNHMVRVRVPKARRKDWRSRDLPKGHIPGDCLPDASVSFLVSDSSSQE
ncbi:hypothetical protein AVEN_235326-1 [Araneus ventricosus]|uniref:Uncharacterized protein n=1 Tax=Araneus ventricosus TaxID=182803 RepID=A0A4Y2A3T9_ARAVE|nr:hypothetical protein AVEN_235326-1 [Araneus ventricosus]